MSDSNEITVYQNPSRDGLIERRAHRHCPARARDCQICGKAAEFAWEEFFQGEIANHHTRKNYIHAVK
jgi:hypothetical protein